MAKEQRWRNGTKIGKTEERQADTILMDCMGYHLISDMYHRKYTSLSLHYPFL